MKGIAVEVEKSRLRSYDEALLLGDSTKLQALTGWRPSPNYNTTVQAVLQYWRAEVARRQWGASARETRQRLRLRSTTGRP